MKHKIGEKTEYLGKILVSVWGYSMRIVDFYAVVEETEKSLCVEKLAVDEKGDGFLTGKSVPVSAKTGESFRVYKRVSPVGRKYLLSSFGRGFKSYPSVWDGRPVRFDHCD